MNPTKYELLIERGVIYLRCFAKETQKGFVNIEAHPFVNGASLPSLRKTGEKRAKFFGVPFIDRTV